MYVDRQLKLYIELHLQHQTPYDCSSCCADSTIHTVPDLLSLEQSEKLQNTRNTGQTCDLRDACKTASKQDTSDPSLQEQTSG